MKCEFIERCVSEDAAKLTLRLAVGILVLMHGIFKLQNPGAVDFIGGLFNNLGLPAFLAYLVYIGEVVAPIMLIVGFRVKLAAALVAITLAVAILLAHASQIFTLGTTGGSAIELQLMFLFGSIAIMGLGAGKYRLGKMAA
jgi:putative oxidoreductase